MPAAPTSSRCSASPASPRQATAGSARASPPCSPTRPRPPRRRRRCCGAATPATAAQIEAIAPVAEQDWVRLTQAQFAPVEITPAFWIVPDLARAARRRAAGDPARPGPGLRHRHASDHAHVPALDRRARRARRPALAARARLRLRLGHPGDRAPRCSAPRDDRRGRHRPGGGRGDARQRAGQRRRSCAPACPTLAQRPLPAGAGQHPGHAAASCSRRCCAAVLAPAGTLVLAGILERQADELQAAYAPWLALDGRRPATTAGS